MSDTQRSVYNQLAQNFVQWRAEQEAAGCVPTRATILAKLGVLKQAAIDPEYLVLKREGAPLPPKYQKALELIDDAVSSGKKFIVVTRYRGVVSRMREALAGYRVTHLWGNMKEVDEKKAIADFQNDPDTQGIIITSQKGGEAINLYAGCVQIFIDLPWEPGEFKQAMGRPHRFGQTRDVSVYVLLSQGSIDWDIWSLIHSKEAKHALVIDGRVILDVARRIADDFDRDAIIDGIRSAVEAGLHQDYDSAIRIWSDITEGYSRNLENIAPFVQSIGIFLYLLKLHRDREKGINLNNTTMLCAPSGPSIKLRALSKLGAKLESVGLSMKDFSVTEYDFSPSMLAAGRAFQDENGLTAQQHVVNMAIDTFPLPDKFKIVETSQLHTFSHMPNIHGVPDIVWAYNQLVQSVEPRGLLIVSSYGKRIPIEHRRVLENSFGLQMLTPPDAKLEFVGEMLKVMYPGENEKVRKIISNLRPSSFFIARKIKEVKHTTRTLKSVPVSGLIFENLFGNGEGDGGVKGPSGEVVDLRDFDFSRIPLDALVLSGGTESIYGTARSHSLDEINERLALAQQILFEKLRNFGVKMPIISSEDWFKKNFKRDPSRITPKQKEFLRHFVLDVQFALEIFESSLPELIRQKCDARDFKTLHGTIEVFRKMRDEIAVLVR